MAIRGGIGKREHAVTTHYWVEISTRWRASLGLWPAPVELHDRLALLQFAHGESLSQRI